MVKKEFSMSPFGFGRKRYLRLLKSKTKINDILVIGKDSDLGIEKQLLVSFNSSSVRNTQFH